MVFCILRFICILQLNIVFDKIDYQIIVIFVLLLMTFVISINGRFDNVDTSCELRDYECTLIVKIAMIHVASKGNVHCKQCIKAYCERKDLLNFV